MVRTFPPVKAKSADVTASPFTVFYDTRFVKIFALKLLENGTSKKEQLEKESWQPKQRKLGNNKAEKRNYFLVRLV
jgi:hypothetical protein